MPMYRYSNTIMALIEAVPELINDAVPAVELQAAIDRGAFALWRMKKLAIGTAGF